MASTCAAVAGGKPAVHDMQASMSSALFTPAVKPSRFVLVNLSVPTYATRYAECIKNAQSWSLTRLQTFYKHEYNSLRSRKQQAKHRHIKFDDRLKDFRDWLIHLGLRPASGWSVHRMSNYKGYQPGNLKWATKPEQTEMRNVTKWHDVNGKKLTTQKFADFLGVSYTCLYKRLQRGWTVQRLLDAQKKHTGIKAWNFPSKLAHHCEPLYKGRKHYSQSRLDWYIAYLKTLLKASNLIQVADEHAKQVALAKELQRAEDECRVLLQEQHEQAALEVELVVAVLTAPKSPSLG